MGHTYHRYQGSNTKGIRFVLKCRRDKPRKIQRYTHHKHKKDNLYANQITYTKFRSNQETGIYGGKYVLREYIEDKIVLDHGYHVSQLGKLNITLLNLQKGLQYDIKISKQGLNLSDLCLSAIKQLKRRGNCLPFKGHRQKRVLYKRQLLEV